MAKFIYVSLMAVIVSSLSACAIGVPKNVDEFKKLASDSSFAKAEHFPIEKSTLAEVEKRLQEFAERCLNIDIKLTKCADFGGCRSRIQTHFVGKVQRENSKIRLTLQRDENTSMKPSSLPEGGMYIMVVEAENAGRIVMGHVYAVKIGYGDLLGSARGYLIGDNKTCPKL